ncbi:hypothetical protein CDAR_89021 [Caerostris darwini]|uniref:Uncharacterized protein n=1 Tax=Caerostris darwini TaxID=1538125 RepID=A0AAV4V035_9ARAC|nr:hypothetical protein CDAR_89021 [Caerostris darwini]
MTLIGFLVDQKDQCLSPFPLPHQSRYNLISLEGQRSLFLFPSIDWIPVGSTPNKSQRKRTKCLVVWPSSFCTFYSTIRIDCSCGSKRQMPEHFSISPSKPLQPNQPGRPKIPIFFPRLIGSQSAPQRLPPTTP